MMKRTFTALVALMFMACSGSDSSNIDGGQDATLADAPSDSTSSDVAVGDASDGGAPDTGTTDGASGCDAGCRVCCRQDNPDAGAIIRHDEMVCACTNPGDCNTSTTCGANLCADMKETAGCVACLDEADAGDCTQKALAKCALQPECSSLEKCLATCGDGG